MFGYRIIDIDGNIFEDQSILSTEIKTVENTWNEREQAYDKETTVYYQGSCTDVANEISNQNTGMAFDIGQIQRSNGGTYKCPTALNKNFVSGTQYSNFFVTTLLQVFSCDRRKE